MARCRVCCEHIERQGEVPGATVANGDRPWVIVQPEIDPETGIGDDIIDDESHEHVPAASVAVIEYTGGAACSWDNRCGYTASYLVAGAPVCSRDMSDAVLHAI